MSQGEIERLRAQIGEMERERGEVNAALRAEVEANARLRKLIADAERGGEVQGWQACPWCSAIREPRRTAHNEPHESTCPAFTPDGRVKP